MEILDNPIITQMERNGCLDGDNEPVLYCDCCEEGIYEGESYWEINGEIYCEHCIDDIQKFA